MNSSPWILALYGPVITTALTVAYVYGRWAINLARGSHTPGMYHLVVGISLAFAGAGVENLWWLFSRLARAGQLGDAFVFIPMEDFKAVVLLFKCTLWVAGVIHLHAYWKAKLGRTWLKEWAVVSLLWYLILLSLSL